MTLRAEIAGAGVAGLGLGTMLARLGWQVRVHERNAEIRSVGAGLYLRNNLITVLESLGIADKVRESAVPLEVSQWADGNGHVFQSTPMVGHRRQWGATREGLIQALYAAAVSAGVEVVTGSAVESATPDGVLRTNAGDECRADLVVAADGNRSKLREALGLTKEFCILPTLATRLMVPNRDSEPEDKTTMYWSGARRVGVCACSPNDTYVYLIAPESDAEGKRIPVDAESWGRDFPVLKPLLEELTRLPAIQHNYVVVKCTRWSRGRVAVVGDAAHALPPLLGQGAGLALSNALVLSRMLDGVSRADVPAVLNTWETTYRRYADATQTWSQRLDTMTYRWPKPLLGIRARALSVLGSTKVIQRRMRMADEFPLTA